MARKGKQAEIDSGRSDGVTSDERSRLKDLEREVSELRSSADSFQH